VSQFSSGSPGHNERFLAVSLNGGGDRQTRPVPLTGPAETSTAPYCARAFTRSDPIESSNAPTPSSTNVVAEWRTRPRSPGRNTNCLPRSATVAQGRRETGDGCRALLGLPTGGNLHRQLRPIATAKAMLGGGVRLHDDEFAIESLDRLSVDTCNAGTAIEVRFPQSLACRWKNEINEVCAWPTSVRSPRVLPMRCPLITRGASVPPSVSRLFTKLSLRGGSPRR
jgi:hypothetical protein